MKKLIKKLHKNFISPVFQVRPFNIPRYIRYWQQVSRYRSLGGTINSFRPILGEDTDFTSIDPHYFYQGVWALEKIIANHPERHVDVGSQAQFVGFLSCFVPLQFVDIRPLPVVLDNFENIRGSVVSLPFTDHSIASLSCLHVAEHIGLGRYGDPLDPEGTKKACAELARVLAPGGMLYFSLPIGRERTEFNAHRVHTTRTIISYFRDLTLVEFSAIDDKGHYIRNADINASEGAYYSCGLFHFTNIDTYSFSNSKKNKTAHSSAVLFDKPI